MSEPRPSTKAIYGAICHEYEPGSLEWERFQRARKRYLEQVRLSESRPRPSRKPLPQFPKELQPELAKNRSCPKKSPKVIPSRKKVQAARNRAMKQLFRVRQMQLARLGPDAWVEIEVPVEDEGPDADLSDAVPFPNCQPSFKFSATEFEGLFPLQARKPRVPYRLPVNHRKCVTRWRRLKNVAEGCTLVGFHGSMMELLDRKVAMLLVCGYGSPFQTLQETALHR